MLWKIKRKRKKIGNIGDRRRGRKKSNVEKIKKKGKTRETETI